MGARVTSVGSYLPEKVLTNADFEKMVDTSDEWIVERTGVRERRIAGPDETSSYMGTQAALVALERGNISPEEIEMILVATSSPDYLCVTTSALIQKELGAVNAAAIDVSAACSGHLAALAQAKAFVESGVYKNVLVISAEKLSTFVDYQDRSTCILFGDGACAFMVQNEGTGFLMGKPVLGADGCKSDVLNVPAGGCKHPPTIETIESRMHYLKMQGPEVFKSAVRQMTHAATRCLEKNGVSADSIKWLVPHQANTRIIEATAKRCEFPMDRVYMKTVAKYGNTSAPSVGIAFDELLLEEPIEVGERVLLVVFGAGFTWGSLLLEKVNG